MQMTSTVTSKGQVLIPAAIRNKLNIKPLDRVNFNILGNKILAEKAPTTESMYGFVKSKKRLTDKQLEKVIDKAVKSGISGDI